MITMLDEKVYQSSGQYPTVRGLSYRTQSGSDGMLALKLSL